MVVRIATVAFEGIEARPVDVQVQITNGTVVFNVVGLGDKAVAESRERVRAALTASGLALPAKRITVNLAPADLPKEGSHYDLPIALGVMAAIGAIPPDALGGFTVLGELALDGSISAVSGVLPAAVAANAAGHGLICPAPCGPEAAWASRDLDVLAPRSLIQLANHFKGTQLMARPEPAMRAAPGDLPDLRDVKGQESAKRALEIAAAGGHNLLPLWSLRPRAMVRAVERGPACGRPTANLRFSTPEQAKGDSHRRQSELARDYATRHDLDLDDKLTFHDLGVSAFRGANAETGRLGQFKQAVEQGLVPAGSVLLVESLDRISRQAARRALRVLEDIVDAGVSVVTLNDGREYDRDGLDRDPGALLMALLIFIRANEESETKSRRLKASWSAKRAKAATKVISARGPAWLRLGEDRTWQVLDDRADVVRRIFTLAASGAGENAIASTLNRDAVPTWGDNGRAPAVMWHKSYVSKILTSRAVLGTLVPFTMVHEGGRKAREAAAPVEGYYPAIVSEALWSAVRSLKQSATPLRGRHAAKPVQNILGGLARCSSCGRAMTRVSKGTAARAGAPKLICTGAKTGAGCEYVGVSVDAVEETIARDFRTLANGGASGALWGAGVTEALAAHQKRIDEIDNRVDELIGGEVEISVEQMWRLVKKLSDEKDDLLEEQENMRNLARDMAEPNVQKYLGALEAALTGESDRTAANVALRQLFAKVEVEATTGQLAFHWKSGEVTALRVEIPTAHDRLSGNAKRQRRTADGRYLPRAA